MAVDTTTNTQPVTATTVPDGSANRAAEQELRNFLEALNSYPDHFARDPQVSFGEHLVMVAAAGQGSSRN